MRGLLFSPYLLLTLTALFWSGNFVLARAIHAQIPPMTLSFWRWVIALCLLLPFVIRPLRQQWPYLKAQWGRVVLLALTGISGFNSLVYLGTQYTGATNALLINAFIPVITILIARLFLHAPMNRIQMGGVALSVIGVMVILSRGDWQVVSALDFNRGDLVIFIAAIAWAVYTILLKGLAPAINRIVLMGVIVAIGLLGILPFYLWELHLGASLELNMKVVASFAYVGIFPSVLAVLFYNYGVAQVGPARASLFIHLMPVFGTLMSIAFLDESFRLYHALGIGGIFVGIYLSSRRERG